MGSFCFRDSKPPIKSNVINMQKISISAEPIYIEKPLPKTLSDLTSNTPIQPQRQKLKKQKLLNNTEVIEEEEGENIKIVKQNNQNLEDFNMIDNCLNKNIFMRNLGKTARKEIIKHMVHVSVSENEVIFNQGAKGSYFYIIKSGNVNLYINDEFIKSVTTGESFGDLALLHDAKRSGTIIASEHTEMWCLERKKFREVIEYINNKNYEENKNFLQSVSFINYMDNDHKSFLTSSLVKEVYDPETYIVKEGDSSSCLYIIKEGEVICSSKGEVVRNLKKGELFGEKSVLTESIRTMDVISKTVVICFSLSVETLKAVIGNNYKDVLYLNLIKYAFRNSSMLNNFETTLIEKAYPSFKINNYEKNNIVINSGKIKNESINIVIEGNLYKNNELYAGRGTLLFENEIYNNYSTELDKDLLANPDCLIATANTQDFLQMVGSNDFKNAKNKSKLIASLKNVPLFKNLSQIKLEKLAKVITSQIYKKDQAIIVQGEIGTSFYIVKSGKIDIKVKGVYVRTLNENEFFGERALFINEPRSATAIANEDVEVYILEKESFKHILENNLKEFLISRIYLQDDSIELNDLDYIKVLGQGSFGSVCLVKCRKSKYLYAIKAMSKLQIDIEHLHSNIDMEKKILLKIDHPFIMKLVKTLKDTKNIFFLTEYIKGKELFDVIRDIGLLNKNQNLFYGGSLMLAVDYLHKRKFIYRDIKPENVMVTEKGFVKLIDFGTAREIVDRTSTIIGTPQYMAPEVISGEGYTFIVDFWSIAVCMYEFVCGGVPFGEGCEDPMDVYSEVLSNDLNFPKFVKDNQFKQLMQGMMRKNRVSRICNLVQIESHAYFAGFDWEALIGLSIDIPFTPDIDNEKLEVRETYLQYLEYKHKNFVPSEKVQIKKEAQHKFDKWFNFF